MSNSLSIIVPRPIHFSVFFVEYSLLNERSLTWVFYIDLKTTMKPCIVIIIFVIGKIANMIIILYDIKENDIILFSLRQSYDHLL